MIENFVIDMIKHKNQFAESFLSVPWNEYLEVAYPSALLVDGVHFRYRKTKISAKTVHCSLFSYKRRSWMEPCLEQKANIRG